MHQAMSLLHVTLRSSQLVGKIHWIMGEVVQSRILAYSGISPLSWKSN